MVEREEGKGKSYNYDLNNNTKENLNSYTTNIKYQNSSSFCNSMFCHLNPLGKKPVSQQQRKKYIFVPETLPYFKQTLKMTKNAQTTLDFQDFLQLLLLLLSTFLKISLLLPFHMSPIVTLNCYLYWNHVAFYPVFPSIMTEVLGAQKALHEIIVLGISIETLREQPQRKYIGRLSK